MLEHCVTAISELVHQGHLKLRTKSHLKLDPKTIVTEGLRRHHSRAIQSALVDPLAAH